MKTIIIETVSNGWIVRPFQPIGNWAKGDLPTIAVYISVEKLQEDIPRLLEWSLDFPLPVSEVEALRCKE
jgi:hypothetical protein